MNVVLDIGNSSVKLAFFQEEDMVLNQTFTFENLFQVMDLLQEKIPERLIVSSVVLDAEDFISSLKEAFPSVLVFDTNTKIPISNLYRTPGTLGPDRLPPLVAARQVFPDSDILNIDAGTCIKYNFMNRSGEFLGGGHFPGIGNAF